ncbi:MAG TPA: hypothetical protein VFA20_27365 [Myxococcaceae bacterium]|nr:hypothetical protein [Myxococcaceae bacterium]
MAVNSVGIAGTGVSVQQVEGMVAGLDKVASTITGVFSPTAGIVDGIGSALGLPDPIKQVAKIAVGVGTGDVMGVVSGAFGLAGDLMEVIAATQYHPNPDPAKCGAGYAPSTPRAKHQHHAHPAPPPGQGHCAPPAPPPPPGCHPPVRADPDLVQERQAIQTLLQDFDAIDNAGGLWFRDGKFSGLDMNAVMNGDFPPEMKQAVRYFQEHPEKYCRMDRSDGFDGLVTRGALQQELCRVNSQIELQGGAPAAQVPSPAPAAEMSVQSTLDQWLPKLGSAQQEVDSLMQQAMNNPDDKNLQLKLQQAQERLKEMFTFLSDMLKLKHEMNMTPISNTR